jgi:hypothetical protein
LVARVLAAEDRLTARRRRPDALDRDEKAKKDVAEAALSRLRRGT